MSCFVQTDALRDLYPASDLTYWGSDSRGGQELTQFVPTHRVRCRPHGSKPRQFTHTDYVVLEQKSSPGVSWGWLPAPVGSTPEEARPAYALDARGYWQALWRAGCIVDAEEVRVRQPAGSRNELGGVVYFVQAGGADGAIKIGWSGDVDRRVPELQTANAEKLTLLATTPGTLLTEKAYHTRFNSARMEAEWFRPIPELLCTINTLRGLAGLTLLERDAGYSV